MARPELRNGAEIRPVYRRHRHEIKPLDTDMCQLAR
jgi:hypothetical protein